MADLSTSFDPSDIAGNSDAASDAGSKAIVAISDASDAASAAAQALSEISDLPTKTTAAWDKSIGSGGDYADWATMIADMPDLIAHAVTVEIKAGTTLTEQCELKNKHGLTLGATIVIRAEKYFPTSGIVPTADSATATTLRDAALATAALGNDYFNDCWIHIIDGTGTDNGYVLITDYIDATGDVVVANWPGTQPDNTSRYVIVGALVDAEDTRDYCMWLAHNAAAVATFGVGFTRAVLYNIRVGYCSYTLFQYCCTYDSYYSGAYVEMCLRFYCRYVGIVANNTANNTGHAGMRGDYCSSFYVRQCGISDNNQRGIFARYGTTCLAYQNFGDGNGIWGTYVDLNAELIATAPECSGSSGNHYDGDFVFSTLELSSIKSGATQGAAGAAADELWKTLGHATLPDDVVLIGV